jgi:hypothetical protein
VSAHSKESKLITQISNNFKSGLDPKGAREIPPEATFLVHKSHFAKGGTPYGANHFRIDYSANP